MGAAQQKEATTFFSQSLAAATPPDGAAFLAKAKQYERQLCGGAELWGAAEPVAKALLDAVVGVGGGGGGGAAPHGQLRWLLQQTSAVLHKATENPNDTIDPSTPAILHLTELLLRHVLRLTKGHSALLVSVLETGGADAADGEGTAVAAAGAGASSSSSPPHDMLKDDAAALLCRSAFEFLTHVQLSASNVTLYLEVLRLLLTMTSSALHHGTDFREDTMDLFTELMMSSPHLGDCIAVLLKVVVGWGKADWGMQTPLLYHEGRQPSMRNFYQMFGGSSGEAGSAASGATVVPYVLDIQTTASSSGVGTANPAGGVAAAHEGSGTGSSGSTGGGGGSGAASGGVVKDPASVLLGSCSCWEQVGRHAAALLCVLVVHQKGGGRNPALEYIVAMQDGTPVSFVRLLTTIRWKLTRFPEISILLYVLLHDHHEFLHTVLNENAALFVSTIQQVLELTYRTCKDASRPALASSGNAGAGAAGDVLQGAVLGQLTFQLRIFSYPFINFMSSTLLLLISQDRVVNRLLCNTPCLPGHLLERYDRGAPVGALAIVVLALGITKGFNERNEALIAVFAPCLVNLAPFVHDIDPYTAQRVSGLLTLVLKKVHRASALLKSATAAAAAAVANEEHTGHDQQSQANSSAPAASIVASVEEAQALEEILGMYMRQLRTIVEGIEALLRGANRHNEHLVYELLYARGKIIDDVEAAVTAANPYAVPTKQLLVNIVEMIKNCEADIASSDQAQSPQEIIAILRRGQRQQGGGGTLGGGADGGSDVSQEGEGGGEAAKNAASSVSGGGGAEADAAAGNGVTSGSSGAAAGGPHSGPVHSDGSAEGASVDLVYSYEESPHSYDFFGPYVWSILLSACRAPGAALWCRHSSELGLFPH